MSEPTSALSLYDMILRVAVAARVAYHGSDGQARAMVPVDEYEFQRCLDVVNDGIRFFISLAPETGWRWMSRTMKVTFAPAVTGTATAADATSITDSALVNDYANDYFNGCVIKITTGTGEGETATVTDYVKATGQFVFAAGLSGGTTPDTTSGYSVCHSVDVLEGDPAKYRLSQDFLGDVAGPIHYEADSGRGRIIDWVSEAEVRGSRSTTTIEGYPTKAAVVPYTDRRWMLFVEPSPSAADTVEFPYRVGFDKLEAISGTATGGGATTLAAGVLANLYADDYFNGWTIQVLNGTGRNSYAVVTDYTKATGTFTVAAWLGPAISPAANSIFYAYDGGNHPAGMQFDEAVLAACLAKAELEFEDLKLGYMDKFLTLDLPRAHQIDARSAPRKLGQMLPGSRRQGHERIWNDVHKV